jgi:hypothetical protein
VETVEECEAEAVRIAEELAKKPRHALGYTRRWLGELDGTLEAGAMDRALAASMGLVGGEEERMRLAEMWRRMEKK